MATDFAAYDKRVVKALAASGIEMNTVYDIGASNGMWSRLVRDALGGGAFHMFEPLAGAYVELRKQTLATYPDLVLHNVGLGSETGSASIQIYESQFGSSFIPSASSWVKERKIVPIWRLDEYREQNELPPPDFVKIDVQGFELEILKGGPEAFNQAKGMILETWLYRGYGKDTPLLGEIIQHMSSLGFVAAGMGSPYIDPDHVLMCVDTVFLKKDVLTRLSEDAVSAIQAPLRASEG